LAARGSVATMNFQSFAIGIITVEVTDNSAAGTADLIRLGPVGRAPTDCSPLLGSPPVGSVAEVTLGDIVVTDALPFPTAKAQCKNGGWRNYGPTFKNEGQCVAFVQRPTKPPT
jgi:hypothetical protein